VGEQIYLYWFIDVGGGKFPFRGKNKELGASAGKRGGLGAGL